MKKFARSLLISLIACAGVRVDPDTLPSIEVLLVPPRHPFPQVEEQLRKVRGKREAAEYILDSKIKEAYLKAAKAMDRELSNIIKPFVQSQPIQQASSFFEPSHNVENLAINILPVQGVGLEVRNEITQIDSKRGIDEAKQVQEGIKELDGVRSLIKQVVEKSMKQFFGKSRGTSSGNTKGNRPSFMEEEQFGIKPVLNVRVGSSVIGDGLRDGSSYPSIIGMVENEVEDRNSAEMILLNSLLFYSHQLGYDCIQFLRARLAPGIRSAQPSSFLAPSVPSDPSSVMTKVVKQVLRFLPPAVPRVWRRRAFAHSTVQLDIHPPTSDSRLDSEMLRAFLKGQNDLRKARLKAYMKAKKLMLKDIAFEIRTTISQLAQTPR